MTMSGSFLSRLGLLKGLAACTWTKQAKHRPRLPLHNAAGCSASASFDAVSRLPCQSAARSNRLLAMKWCLTACVGHLRGAFMAVSGQRADSLSELATQPAAGRMCLDGPPCPRWQSSASVHQTAFRLAKHAAEHEEGSDPSL